MRHVYGVSSGRGIRSRDSFHSNTAGKTLQWWLAGMVLEWVSEASAVASTHWIGPRTASRVIATIQALVACILLAAAGATAAPSYSWHTFYGGGTRDRATRIAFDTEGNTYIAGFSQTSWNGPGGRTPLHAYSGGFDIFVLKLNSAGAYQWHTFYGSGGEDYARDLAVDAGGNVYVVADSQSSWNGPAGQAPLHAFTAGLAEIVVLKLTSDGAYQWHTFYGCTSSDTVSGIVLDSGGSLYISGQSYRDWDGPAGQDPVNAYGEIGTFYRFFALKLTSDGAYQWHTFHGKAVSRAEDAGCVALDSAGNVYLTGSGDSTWTGPTGQAPLHAYSGHYDLMALKLSNAGAYQWHAFYGSASGDDDANGLSVDASGNVFVVGHSGATWSGPSGQGAVRAFAGGNRSLPPQTRWQRRLSVAYLLWQRYGR